VARTGFSHPDAQLKVDDFSAFVANFEPKPENLKAIARELNLGLDSLVFVDDNPFERELVARTLPDVAVVGVGDVTRFAEVIDREGWFEPFSLTKDDLPRAAMYAADKARDAAKSEFESYEQYLEWLQMKAEVAPFCDVYLERIAQLINKTNQFNLTTRRYSLAEVQAIAKNPEYVTLYGRLEDRFGDNGLVSVVIGRVASRALHVDSWLMSCRVLKRTFENTMFEALCEAARARGLTELIGTYLRTPKNAMVASHYESLGFRLVDGEQDGARSTWSYALDQAPKVHSLIRRVEKS
jgi:FkbH-like protein